MKHQENIRGRPYAPRSSFLHPHAPSSILFIMITCEWENGNKVYLRHAVVDGLVVDGNRILLAKRAADMLNAPNLWCLPGGYLDRDETAAQAIVREVREETGYEARIKNLFFINTAPELSTDRQNISFFFILEPVRQAGQPDHETAEIKWYEMDALPPLDQIAFKHEKIIELYRQHLKQPGTLPMMNL